MHLSKRYHTRKVFYNKRFIPKGLKTADGRRAGLPRRGWGWGWVSPSAKKQVKLNFRKRTYKNPPLQKNSTFLISDLTHIQYQSKWLYHALSYLTAQPQRSRYLLAMMIPLTHRTLSKTHLNEFTYYNPLYHNITRLSSFVVYNTHNLKKSLQDFPRMLKLRFNHLTHVHPILFDLTAQDYK